MTDQELQEYIERGLAQGDSPDERAYRRVFDALTREPSPMLSSGFAARVISRLPKPAASRDLLWLSIGVTSLVIAMIVAVAMTGFTLNWGVFKFISGYQGLIAFGVAFVLGLQWVDKRFLQKRGLQDFAS